MTARDHLDKHHPETPVYPHAAWPSVPRRTSTWTRHDSLVVLASYQQRPRGHRLVPEMELERVAGLLNVPVETVRRRMQAFAGLDPANPAREPERVSARDRRLWREYEGDAWRLQTDAEWIVQQRKRRPKALYGD